MMAVRHRGVGLPKVAAWAVVCAAMPFGTGVRAAEPLLEPSEALGCLTSTRGKAAQPEFPFVALKHEVSGSVRVQLRFDAPDAAPQLTILAREGATPYLDEFEAAVRRHAESLRVPCQAPGEPAAQIVQQFDFVPATRQVESGTPSDPSEAARRSQVACIAHPRFQEPNYAVQALRRNVRGRVYTRLRFDAPDQPPVIETLARPSAKPLADEVRRWAEDLRMPCLAGEPVRVSYVFMFGFQGQAYGMRPMNLVHMLPSVQGIDEQELALDTSTMACPFDVLFQYLQPLARNRVDEQGPTMAQRQPLLDWLHGVQFKFDRPQQADAIFADTTVITVPCVQINLKPKE